MIGRVSIRLIFTLACILLSPFVYAHGGGLYLVYIGVPSAILAFVVSAILLRCIYKKINIWLYGVISIFILPIWVAVYFLSAAYVADFLDKYFIRYGEEIAVAFILPLLLVSFSAGLFLIKRK